ncbi:kinase-like domain-containing protein [Mycena latifolia]|nr:kinase-like domain-containing protein [Mycena latifolia]
MVFEVLGESLVALIKRSQKTGVPIPIVKHISKQVLLGVDYLHRFCNIIHTDIKPENIFLQIDDRHGNAITDRITVKITGLGSATWSNHHFTEDIQTRQYRSPEVIVGAKWGTTVDIWSVACVIFELVTGEYLFEPVASSSFSKDDDHLAQIMELMNMRECPRSISIDGKYSSDLFNPQGELVLIPSSTLKLWPLDLVLHEKYSFPKPEADALASFLTPMLLMDPDRRAEAKELVSQNWLAGVVVPGELDVIDGAKDEQLERDEHREGIS